MAGVCSIAFLGPVGWPEILLFGSCCFLPLLAICFIALLHYKYGKTVITLRAARDDGPLESAPWPKRAVKASWATPGLGMILLLIVLQLIPALIKKTEGAVSFLSIFVVLTCAALLSGIILSVAALLGMKRYGRHGILIPALFGLFTSLIFSAFLLFMILGTLGFFDP